MGQSSKIQTIFSKNEGGVNLTTEVTFQAEAEAEVDFSWPKPKPMFWPKLSNFCYNQNRSVTIFVDEMIKICVQGKILRNHYCVNVFILYYKFDYSRNPNNQEQTKLQGIAHTST